MTTKGNQKVLRYQICGQIVIMTFEACTNEVSTPLSISKETPIWTRTYT